MIRAAERKKTNEKTRAKVLMLGGVRTRKCWSEERRKTTIELTIKHLQLPDTPLQSQHYLLMISTQTQVGNNESGNKDIEENL